MILNINLKTWNSCMVHHTDIRQVVFSSEIIKAADKIIFLSLYLPVNYWVSVKLNNPTPYACLNLVLQVCMLPQVWGLCIACEDSYIVAGSSDNEVRVWRVTDSKEDGVENKENTILIGEDDAIDIVSWHH